jgi:predicted short-subunit dehydrogenase-like oxidoreductase (DUF2520 family)
LIGPGRLGQALGRLLSQAGFSVGWVAARRLESARRAVRFIGKGRPAALRRLEELAGAKVVLVTTADSAIQVVAQRLAALPTGWRGAVALHTCGSLDASVLEPLRQRGAFAGSIHPFQTVPNREAGVRNLVGAYWGLEGDPEAVRLARRWVKALGGVALGIRSQHKTLYHAAAVMSCGAVVALMDQSARMLRRAGVPPKMAKAILGKFVAETASNFAQVGARRSLTGPAARGDWETLGRHQAVLQREFPAVVPLYQELVRAMARLATKRKDAGGLSGPQARTR